ncbi:E3 ubiquitin-protein ligase Topors-like [Empidonax traillii]|uniref:E3 ubiquitin-protein ligase Topors-like n=1 Tax=Empidonax traillii TaxID=164674 RepID=UPI000FFDAE1A|nr:E3 ubiquitin-protein ligase Topors-like [Empidonax traillii]
MAGSISWSSALPSTLQSTEMAMETDWSCPICRDTRRSRASALPCCHQFCLSCILQWAQRNPSCPLCRTPIDAVRFSEQGRWDSLLFVIMHPGVSPQASSQERQASRESPETPLVGKSGPQCPAASPSSSPQGTQGTFLESPREQGAAGPKPVGGILPEVWAELFQRQQHLLDPVLPWLRQRLEEIYCNWWLPVQVAESRILSDLCVYGLHEETLILRLQNHLRGRAAPLVRDLIKVIVSWCSEEAQRLLHSHTDGEETDGSYVSQCDF